MISPKLIEVRRLLVELSHIQLDPNYSDTKRGLALRARHIEIQQEIGERGEEWLGFFWAIYDQAVTIVDMADDYPLAPNWATERMRLTIEDAERVIAHEQSEEPIHILHEWDYGDNGNPTTNS